MARLPRMVLAGYPHHVGQCGHNGQLIVADEPDRRQWCDLLRDAAATHAVSLHAWTLRDHEFHLVATPSTVEGLSRMMQALTRRHAAAYNRRHGRRGTLWDGRFRATLVEPGDRLLELMLYVETRGPSLEDPDAPHPVWSSLGHHLGSRRDPTLSDPAAWWALGNTPFEREAVWRQRVIEGLPAGDARRWHTALQRGWPVGSPAFLAHLADAWERPLAPRPRGRPRRGASNTHLCPSPKDRPTPAPA